MLLIALLCSRAAAEDGPLLRTDILGGFDDWNYSEIATCNLSGFVDYYCVCNATTFWQKDATGAEWCVTTCPTNTTAHEFGCFTDANWTALNTMFPVQGTFHFHDVISAPGGAPTSIDVAMDATVQNNLSLAAKKCASMKDRKSCNFVSNMCVLSMYDNTATACSYFNMIFTDTVANQWGNFNWPKNKPFLRYTDTFRHSIDDPIIKSSWTNGQILQIYLGVFSKEGQFKGIRKLEADLSRCHTKNDLALVWQQLGYSYYSSCVFDLSESFVSDSTDFYDPFLVENISGNAYMRPMGTLVKNYYENGVAVNRDSVEDFWSLQRRFFTFDNYSTTDYVQYVKNISLVFEVFDNHRELKVPYFVVDYVQVSKAGVQSDSRTAPFTLDKETLSHPGFSFSVVYTGSFGGYWSAMLYVFIVMVMLGITYWIVRVFVYQRSYGYGGRDCHNVFAMISLLLDVIATVLLIMLVGFSVYLLWFYKWTKSMRVLLPTEDEFLIFVVVLWLTLAIKLVAMIIRVILQTNCDFFLIDWEEPKRKNVEISAWRRIMIANEWNKISSIRACSVSFTLIFMVFLLDGLDLQLMGEPIPTPALIDVGNTYPILRFAFTAFVWLLLLLVQWLLIRFVYWKITGDPFEQFMQLCYASNISVMLLPQRSHGFYIHGKNARRVTDVGHQTVNDNFDQVTTEEEEEQLSDSSHSTASEMSFAPPFKGLNPMEPTRQVQEIYLSTDCFNYIQDKYYGMKLEVTRKRKNGQHDPAPYETYDSTNLFLKKFFSQTGCEHRYIFQGYSYIQIVDIGPVVEEDSIFTTAPNFMIKDTMMYGIQGSLMVFYMLLFSALDTATERPCIAGFVVFVVDIFVKILFKYRGRSNLANKALVDPRFILI